MAARKSRKAHTLQGTTAIDRTVRSTELEAMRIRHEYKRLILLGKIAAPLGAARRLVGPDCAFHLYSRLGK